MQNFLLLLIAAISLFSLLPLLVNFARVCRMGSASVGVGVKSPDP